ncbi:pyridoxal phosphate-dependent aminotransferase [Robertmurraya sp. DFI.2.37]|uniref:MalY/PatB family protein n=1 Tax=Robertmurraya sp. DFI.2.37 TaxID=3031819 RepID=UPI001246DA34|nr:MalY/PatB family protein [Robertmurraya sp. DFI.2.37]MDF1511021.1 pyridoxal phosphate-dependent aminotransferase [Robertmurraya sp. DFI.2.37]
MTFSFDQVINRVGSYCTQWDYIEDRFGEKDLLPFSISDTDFQCPQNMLQVLHKRLEHGIFGYTRWNHDDFKGAIATWYRERFLTEIEKKWIVYSPTVIYTISKMIELLTDEGDYVITQTPAYDAFFKVINDNKRVLFANKLVQHNGKYEIDFEDLEEKLSHTKAKVLLLCSPHNPTGRVWTKQELELVRILCKKYKVFIISDEIHMDIVRKPYCHIPILNGGQDLDNICICTSASKTFNTPGLGGSYAIIPNLKLREEFLLTLKNKDGLSSASTLGALGIMTGYNECASWVDELNGYIEGNMIAIKEFLEQYLPQASFHVPEATYLAWIDMTNFSYTNEELQEALVHHGKVAIMSGETYGEGGKGYLRMNVGCPRSKVIEGLKRLRTTMDYLGSRS